MRSFVPANGLFRGARRLLSVLCLIGIVCASFQSSDNAVSAALKGVQATNFSTDTAVKVNFCPTCGVMPSNSICGHADHSPSSIAFANETLSSCISGLAVFEPRREIAMLDIHPSVHGEPPKA